MKKMYIDEMPKGCFECPVRNRDRCQLKRGYIGGKCPLHTIEELQNEKAIECLERMKILCKSNFDFWENSEYEGNIYDKHDVSNVYLNVGVNIDSLIAKLKGEKDE